MKSLVSAGFAGLNAALAAVNFTIGHDPINVIAGALCTFTAVFCGIAAIILAGGAR